MSAEQRMVQCIKLGEDLPGLQKPPFKGPVGERIFESVSQKAWDMWVKDMQIKVLNEYRLNKGDPKDYQVLVDQMLLFLGLEQGAVKEVENADRGRAKE